MDTSYLCALPEHMTRTMPVDVILTAEGQEFPAHQFVLGVNSAVFAEFLSQARSSSSHSVDQLRIPLVDDAAKDVCTALTYFYRGCAVMSPSKPDLKSTEDAISLARFAHKYDVTDLVRECESYLVAKAQVNSGSAMFTSVPATLSMLILAESCHMDELLAHCELFMIKSQDKNFWQNPALLSEGISRQCLLRLLRGAQLHLVNSEASIADLQAQTQQGTPQLAFAQPAFGAQDSPFPFGTQPSPPPFGGHASGGGGFGSPNNFRPANRANVTAHDRGRHVSIATLMEWAKTV